MAGGKPWASPENGASTVTKFHDNEPLVIEAPLIMIHRGTSVVIDIDY